MRRRSRLGVALASFALLVAPGAAHGAKQRYSSGDLSFVAIGERTEKGRIIPEKVRDFTITASPTVRCTKADGFSNVTMQPQGWIFPGIGPLKVSKSGSFSGQFTEGDAVSTITGRIRSGKASGTLQGQSGPPGSATVLFCKSDQLFWTANPRG